MDGVHLTLSKQINIINKNSDKSPFCRCHLQTTTLIAPHTLFCAPASITLPRISLLHSFFCVLFLRQFIRSLLQTDGEEFSWRLKCVRAAKPAQAGLSSQLQFRKAAHQIFSVKLIAEEFFMQNYSPALGQRATL